MAIRKITPIAVFALLWIAVVAHAQMVIDPLSGRLMYLPPGNVEMFNAFAAGDSTPSVGGWSNFQLADTTTISNFDDGVEGQTIRVYCPFSGAIDLTDSGITAVNRTGDYTATVGDMLIFTRTGGVWYLENAPSDTVRVATDGAIFRIGDGMVSARTHTGSSTITVTNGDGVSGNPTYSIPSGSIGYALTDGSGILLISPDDTITKRLIINNSGALELVDP